VRGDMMMMMMMEKKRRVSHMCSVCSLYGVVYMTGKNLCVCVCGEKEKGESMSRFCVCPLVDMFVFLFYFGDGGDGGGAATIFFKLAEALKRTRSMDGATPSAPVRGLR
jgi:hypothetical protein